MANTCGEALTLTGLGHLHVMGGDNQTRAITTARPKSWSSGLVIKRALRILNGLGAAHVSGDLEAAVRYYEQAAAAFRRYATKNGEKSSLLPSG